ncbi:hypothetical protein [Pseudomonas phage vB_PaeP_FMD5]
MQLIKEYEHAKPLKFKGWQVSEDHEQNVQALQEMLGAFPFITAAFGDNADGERVYSLSNFNEGATLDVKAGEWIFVNEEGSIEGWSAEVGAVRFKEIQA